MLSEKHLKILKRSLMLKHEKHIGVLVGNPKNYLDQIIPNRYLPIPVILKEYNSDVGAELVRYGKELKDEIIRILSSFNDVIFTEEDKLMVISLVENYCNPDLYIKRFQLMLGSIERRMGQYGLKFDQGKYRTDIPKSLCEVGARNITRRIKQEIIIELDIFVQNSKSRIETTESVIAETANVLELKPNFMGLGINFNAIIEKFFRKRKT